MISYENDPRHKIVLHTQCSTEECQIVKHSAQLTKSRSENVLITSFLGYKTLDSNVMGTSIMESFLYGLQNVIV